MSCAQLSLKFIECKQGSYIFSNCILCTSLLLIVFFLIFSFNSKGVGSSNFQLVCLEDLWEGTGTSLFFSSYHPFAFLHINVRFKLHSSNQAFYMNLGGHTLCNRFQLVMFLMRRLNELEPDEVTEKYNNRLLLPRLLKYLCLLVIE